MRRRDKVGGKAAKTQRRKTAARKRGHAPKAARRGGSSADVLSKKVALFKRERDEALEQQKATSEVLRVISSSPGELEPVFNAMLANATRICEATIGTLYLYEGTQFRGVALHHSKQSYVDYWRSNPVVELKKHSGTPLDRLSHRQSELSIFLTSASISPISKKAVASLPWSRTQACGPLCRCQ